jgi:uncharacterized membrane protein YkoI
MTSNPITTSACRHDRRGGGPLALHIASVILAAACCIPGAATAETGNVAVTQAVNAPGAKISREKATQAALQALPGKVTDVTIEKKRGKSVYVIEIVADKDGAETDVLVDMDSGTVIGMEH